MFFVLGRDSTHAWGAPAVFWGGTRPKMHFSGAGPVSFFWGTILAWGAQAVILEGHITRLWGTSSELGKTAPKIPPLVAPGLIHSAAHESPQGIDKCVGS